MSFKYVGHVDAAGHPDGCGSVTCAVDAVEDGKPIKQQETVARVYPGDDGKSPRIDFCCPVKINSAKEIADLVQANWKPETPPVAVLSDTERLKAKIKELGGDPDAV